MPVFLFGGTIVRLIEEAAGCWLLDAWLLVVSGVVVFAFGSLSEAGLAPTDFCSSLSELCLMVCQFWMMLSI